jgi:uncharacterized protein (DUF736 family)
MLAGAKATASNTIVPTKASKNATRFRVIVGAAALGGRSVTFTESPIKPVLSILLESPVLNM